MKETGMNKILRRALAFLIVLFVTVISCKTENDKPELPVINATEKKESSPDAQEEEIKASIEDLLFAAGNYDVAVLDSMTSDNAMLGISRLSDGTWSNSEITIGEFFKSMEEDRRNPYCEIPHKYDILITEGRMALARAECILYRWGVPQTKEINHFTLMKENDKWKFLNISWTLEELSQEEKIFDLDVFARSYAQAWSSQRPNFVSSFFAKNGSLSVNNGAPAEGTEAITQVARGFMEAFPDMVVSLDSLVTKSDNSRFYWTLTGTNKGPGGTGKTVKISGYEEWTMNKEGLIQESKGNFDEKEYNRQLEFGINN